MFELSSGDEILRSVWLTSQRRPWHHIFNWRTWQIERQFRQMLTDCGSLQVLDALSTPEAELALIELPALEKLNDENGVPHPHRQREYADQTLRSAACNLFIFNAEETNPMVDERALSYLKRLGSVRPILVLNRIDLYTSDHNPLASLERRITQINRAWSKVFGEEECPHIHALRADFPALLMTALNPRSSLQHQEFKRLKQIVRSEDALEEESTSPHDWVWPRSRELIASISNYTRIDKLFREITRTLTERV